MTEHFFRRATNRRIFIAGLIAVALSAGATHAEEAQKLRRIGWLSSGHSQKPGPALAVVLNSLRELGWVEGRNLVVERRYGEEINDRLSELAAELIAQKVEVIVALDQGAARAAKNATTTIPIVMSNSDPLGGGFAESLARPGANI